MSAPWWLGSLVAYSVQLALVVLVGGLAAALLRLKQPRVTLAYWQAVLAGCLLLPLLEPWQRITLAPARGAATIVRMEAGGVDSLVFLFPFHTWVLLGLGAGVGLGLLRLAVGLSRLHHYRRAAHHIAPLPGALRKAQALVGVAPTFYFSEHVQAPVTFGWLDPAVIFPERFARMDESHQRAIACHELLHVARHDWLLNLLEELILTLFWFHPAVWWVMRSIRLGREQVVDCEVVALTGARKSYLHALLEIAGAARAMPVPAPLFLGESQLAERVALLVKEVHMSKKRLIASLVIAVAALLVAGGLAVWAFPLMAPAGTPPTTTENGAGTVYKVGGDVTAPVPIFKPEPPYTPQGRKDKVQGTVVLMLTVDASGNVADVQVKKSLRADMDASALKTVSTWKFKPALRKGKPVPVSVSVEVTFRFY